MGSLVVVEYRQGPGLATILHLHTGESNVKENQTEPKNAIPLCVQNQVGGVTGVLGCVTVVICLESSLTTPLPHLVFWSDLGRVTTLFLILGVIIVRETGCTGGRWYIMLPLPRKLRTSVAKMLIS